MNTLYTLQLQQRIKSNSLSTTTVTLMQPASDYEPLSFSVIFIFTIFIIVMVFAVYHYSDRF